MRTFVTFEADFPDDSQWDEEGNLLIPGGRAIAVALTSALRGLGTPATEPLQHGFYGWSFESTWTNLRAFFVLQDCEPWLLQIEPKRKGILGFFQRRPPAEVARLLLTVHLILSDDRRISELRWFSRQEYESANPIGSDSPV